MKIFLWSAFLLLFSASISAQDDLDDYTIDELDSLRTDLSLKSQYDQSMIYGMEVYKRTRQLNPSDSSYTEPIFTLGILYYYLGDYDLGLQYLFEAKDLIEKQNLFNVTWAPRLYGYIGYLYDDLGEYELAESYYNRNLFLLDSLNRNHTEYYAIQLTDLAFLYSRMGLTKKAKNQYLIAQTMYERLFPDGRNQSYIQMLVRLATLYDFHLQQYTIAEPIYLRAIQLSESLEDFPPLARASHLSKLGGMYQQMGAFQKAASLYKQVQQLYIDNLGSQHPAYAGFLGNMAFLYMDMKDYEKAEYYYKKSLSIDSATIGTSNMGYAITLANLAGLYEQQKKYKEAEYNYLQAIAINKKILGEEHADFAIDLKNLGYLYLLVEKYQKSEKLLKKVLAIEQKSIGEHQIAYGITLYYLGKLEAARKNWQKSLDYYTQTLHTYFPSVDQINLDNIASLSTQESIADLEVIKVFHQLVHIYDTLYQKNQDQQILHQKQQVLQTALLINNRIQKNFSNEADKYSALRRTSEIIEQVLQTTSQLYSSSPQSLFDEKILSYTEQNKSVLLAQTIDNQQLTQSNILPDSIQQMEEDLEQEANEIKALLADAKTYQDSSIANAQQNEWAIKKSNLKHLLLEKYPKYFQSKKQFNQISIDTLRSYLAVGSMLVSYFVGEQHTYVVGITSDNFYFHQLEITQKALNTRVAVFRKALSDYQFILNNPTESYQNYVQEAQWFYTHLLHPVMLDATISNLVIIADGNLGHLPFEVFLTQQVSLQQVDYSTLPYLLHDYTISYNYAAKLWLENQQPRTLNNNNYVLGYASTYNQDTTQLGTIRNADWVKMRSHLTPLPATSKELDNISKIYAGTYRKGVNANEQQFKQEAEKYSIIHLAMHGILDQQNPILSSMAFTENRDTAEDNFLQVHEIYQLNLNADMVVLSACETGYGKFQQGEGILSLARSFMYAGTPSLVVSLWQVNDQATAIIMELFYQNIAKGLPKDIALQSAKLTYIQKATGAAQHPAFWSAFIAIGDNQPIDTNTKKSPLLRILAGMGGLILLFGLGWWTKTKIVA